MDSGCSLGFLSVDRATPGVQSCGRMALLVGSAAMSWLASMRGGAPAGARPGCRLLERIDLELDSVLLYLATAASGAVAGSGARRALRSADTDVMCRVSSSGTAAVGISASGSSLIGAPDGVMLISWNPMRAPRARAFTRSAMPNA